MAGNRERPAAPDTKFQEQISGQKAPGSNYVWDAIKGGYRWVARPGVGPRKDTVWDTVDRLWNQLFGKKGQTWAEKEAPDVEASNAAKAQRQAKRDEIASLRSRLEAAGRDTSGFTDEELLKWNAAGAFKKFLQ